MEKFIKWLGYLGLFFFSYSMAQQQINPSAAPAASTSVAAALPKDFIVCPPISSLVRNPTSLLWSTQDQKWKSFAASFTPSINEFLGAQWQGVKVGNVFCLYKGEKMTFTIALEYDNLVQQPTGENWVMKKKGLYNCIANDQSKCPFQPLQQSNDEDTSDLGSLRKTTSSDANISTF